MTTKYLISYSAFCEILAFLRLSFLTSGYEKKPMGSQQQYIFK